MTTPSRNLEFIMEYVDDPNGPEDLLRAYAILFSKDLPVTFAKDDWQAELYGNSQPIPANDGSSQPV